MQLTGIADHRPVEQQRGAAPRMPGRLLRGADLELDARGPGDRAGGLDGVGPDLTAAGAPPTGPVDITVEDDADVAWLIRDAGVERRQLGIGRAVLDAQLRHRRLSGRRQVDQAHLVEREVAVTPADIADEAAQQARQQRRAQLGLGVRQRVHQPGGPPTGIVRREPERVVHLRGDEGVGEHLGRIRPRPEPVRRCAAAAGPPSARVRAAAWAAPTGSCRSPRAAGSPRPGRPPG